jgi:hypothetical protein
MGRRGRKGSVSTLTSALLSFSGPPLQLPPHAKATGFTSFAELGLMTGAADPMMKFPAGTTFTPYSVLRNISAAPVSLTPTIWWMQNGQASSAQLQPIQLLPNQSQTLNVPAMLVQAGLSNYNGSFNLVFNGNFTRGALLTAAGSVDQTKTYVFEVTPRGVAESASMSLQYWSTGNGDDTMITLWNPADEAQDFIFKLFFTGGHYSVPIHLEPRATRTLNVSDITMNPAPDAEGNTIPPSIQEGSIKITASHADNEVVLLAIDAGIYNVRKATCGQDCFTCDGYGDYEVEDDPFSVGVGGQDTLTLSAAYDNGSRYTFAGTWSSNNTSVATVGSSTGTATGVSPGSVTVSAYVTDPEEAPVYAGEICVGGSTDPCPVACGGGGESTGTVMPTISQINPPTGVQGTAVPITISGSGFGSSQGKVTTSAGTVSVSNWSDGSISGTLNISGSAALQSYPVVVTTSTSDTNCPSCQATTSFYVTAECSPTVVASAPSPVACDGKTLYTALLTIGGADEANVTSVDPTAASSNVLTIELQGAPYTYTTFCSTGNMCYGQDFKSYTNNQSNSANINWSVQIFCSNSPYPSQTVSKSTTVTCQ